MTRQILDSDGNISSTTQDGTSEAVSARLSGFNDYQRGKHHVDASDVYGPYSQCYNTGYNEALLLDVRQKLLEEAQE